MKSDFALSVVERWPWGPLLETGDQECAPLSIVAMLYFQSEPLFALGVTPGHAVKLAPMATTQLSCAEPSNPSGNVPPAGGPTAGSAATPIAEIVPEVYDELRRLAAAYLRGERAGHTLQATALVHEAYVRLREQTQIEWQNPQHVIGTFARVMRQTLTNYAVARGRLKRGGDDPEALTIEFYESRQIDVTVLHEALQALETFDPRQAQIVELRFFGGLTIEEIAELLSISPATVKRDWTIAKLWLRRELSAGEEGETR